MRFRPFFAWLTLVVLTASAGRSAEPIFRTKVTASQVGDRVKIAFAVSAPTDVEVAVLDARGKVVRHLAAGVLGGKNPPPAPLKPGLTQELVWDGTDDRGKKAEGSFQVRARAGTGIVFGRILADSPYNFSQTMCRGLAVDANGDVYVLGLKDQDAVLYFLRVYDRKGNYLREILPYPSSLKLADRQPFGAIVGTKGEAVPQNYDSLWPAFYPFFNRQAKLMGLHPTDGSVVLLSETPHAFYRIRKSDGGAVGNAFAETFWDQKGRPRVALTAGAFAPDGKTLYLSGFAGVPPKGKKLDEAFPDGRVYAVEVGKPGIKTFVDVPLPEKVPAPTQAWHISGNICALHGLAVDRAGRVFVCDALNGKVWVYQPTGKLEGSVDVPGAYLVAVDEKTGALYVLTRRNSGYHKWQKSLVKVSGWKAGSKIVDTLAFPESGGGADPFLAVDGSTQPVQIWVSGCPRVESIVRIEDAGKLRIVEDLADRDKTASGFAARLAVDPETDLVYVNDGWAKHLRYNGITGDYAGELDTQGRPKPILGSELCVRQDGVIYRGSATFSGKFTRLNRDLTPAPLKDGTSEFGYYYGRMGGGYFGNHGSCVTPEGRLLTLCMFNWCQYALVEVGPDGKGVEHARLKDAAWPDGDNYQKAGIHSALVGWLPPQCGGVKVGPRGQIYVGLRILPRDYQAPASFAKLNGYNQMLGSVIQFKPSGGAVHPDDGRNGKWTNGPVELPIPDKFTDGLPMGELTTQHGVRLKQTFVEGAVRAYPGLGPFSGYQSGAGCVCQTPRFDVDAFGRLYLPNALTCSVTIMDDSGNEITRFGGYGNHDSQGPRSALPAAAIPLAYPVAVQVSFKHLYIADSANRRVVRADRTWKAEDTCPVK
jgi:hypothetical protein